MMTAPPGEAPADRALLSRWAQVVLAIVASVTLVEAVLFATGRYPYEYLEGVLFDAARRILDGTPLYCDLHAVPCVLLPHPPVYVGFVAEIASVVGLSVHLGRGVSAVAFIATLFLMHRIAKHSVPARTAMLAPLLYLVFAEVGYFSVLMRPEPAAICLEMVAILVVLTQPSVAGSSLAGAVLALALFTKPNLLAGPAALSLLLLLRGEWKRLGAFIATVAATAAVVLVIGDHLSDGHFIKNHVLSHAGRIYAWAQFTRIIWYAALPWVGLIVVAGATAIGALRRRELDFPVLWFLFAVIWCPLSASIQGAAPYYYLELYASIALLVTTRAEQIAATPWLRTLLHVQLLVALIENPVIAGERYLSYRALWKDGDALTALLRADPKMVLVEDPIVAAASGKVLLAEVFMNSQAAQRGTWDEGPMVALLEKGDIDRVVLRETPIERITWLQRERFTPRMIDVVKRRFALEWADGQWFVYTHKPD